MRITLFCICTLFICGCYNADNEIMVVPRGYTGYVVVVYDQKNGAPEKYHEGWRVYEIPPSGILRTQFLHNPGWSEFPKFYSGSIEPGSEITYVIEHEDVPVDKPVAYGGSTVAVSRDKIGRPPVRYDQYKIGNLAQIQAAHAILETLSILRYAD